MVRVNNMVAYDWKVSCGEVNSKYGGAKQVPSCYSRLLGEVRFGDKNNNYQLLNPVC